MKAETVEQVLGQIEEHGVGTLPGQVKIVPSGDDEFTITSDDGVETEDREALLERLRGINENQAANFVYGEDADDVSIESEDSPLSGAAAPESETPESPPEAPASAGRSADYVIRLVHADKTVEDIDHIEGTKADAFVRMQELSEERGHTVTLSLHSIVPGQGPRRRPQRIMTPGGFKRVPSSFFKRSSRYAESEAAQKAGELGDYNLENVAGYSGTYQ